MAGSSGRRPRSPARRPGPDRLPARPTFGAYKGATTQARATFKLWQGFFIAGLIVGGFVLLLILWAIFRYRRKSDEIPRQTQYHTLTEIIYTVLPILTVFGLFAFTVIVENEVTAVEPTRTRRSTCSPSSGAGSSSTPTASRSSARPPTPPPWSCRPGETTRIYLRSYDVLHGFYVPEFNFSRYASPGYWTSFDLNVIHNGVYRGQCTQLCGLYHSLMFFNVRSVSPSAYQTWLQTTASYQQAHPSSIGQLPAALHANINGTVGAGYSGNSGNSGNSGSGGNSGDTGGGADYGG